MQESKKNPGKAPVPELNPILANALALFLKTKNFHWHVTGPHFSQYHALLDTQSEQILQLVDPLAERVRKLGDNAIRSVGHVARLQTIVDNDEERVSPQKMLAELQGDNVLLLSMMRKAHVRASEAEDVATCSLLEEWIDEAELRIWFLRETLNAPSESA